MKWIKGRRTKIGVFFGGESKRSQKNLKDCESEGRRRKEGRQNTGWGKSKFTVVCMENNTIISK